MGKGNIWRAACGLLVLGFTCVSVYAQQPNSGADPQEEVRPTAPGPESSAHEEPLGQASFLKWQFATDDWFGLRHKLEDHGVTFNASLISDWAKNFTGGIRTDGYNFGDLLNVSLTLDTEKLIKWPAGGKIFTLFQNENGEFATADVGDVQVVDNLDADGRTQLAELWYEQSLLDDRLRIRLGKINVNGDFAAVEHGSLFINSSMGISPTVLGIPKYPDPATGLQIWTEPTKNLYVAGGVFDGASHEGFATGDRGPKTLFGAPSDLFLIGEAGLKWQISRDALAGKIGVGVWRHTGTWARFDGGVDDGTNGLYLVADQVIFKKHPADKDDDQGLGAFLQYGWADPNVSPIEHHIGGGIAWKGAIPSRDNDVIGLGATCAVLSDKPAAGFDTNSETAIETFYRIELTPWLIIQPDLQYVINPGGISARQNAFVGILRVVINF